MGDQANRRHWSVTEREALCSQPTRAVPFRVMDKMALFSTSWSQKHTHVPHSSVTFNFTVNRCEVNLSTQVKPLNASAKIMNFNYPHVYFKNSFKNRKNPWATGKASIVLPTEYNKWPILSSPSCVQLSKEFHRHKTSPLKLIRQGIQPRLQTRLEAGGVGSDTFSPLQAGDVC